MLPINEIMGSVCQHWIQEIQTDSLRLWSIFILLQASVMAVREPFLEISKTVGHAVMPYIAMLMYMGSLSKEAQVTCTYLHPHSSLTEIPQAQTAEAERFASVIRLVKASLASCRITL